MKKLLLGALHHKWWMLLAAVLGFLTAGSAVGLMMTSAYIISAAALHPAVAELQVAIVGVRFFGLTRAIFRYLERLISHSTTLRLLAQIRVWFFQALEPLVPAQLVFLRSGDLLSRVTSDIEMLQNFYIRVLAPPLVALLVMVAMALLYEAFVANLGWILLLFMVLAGWGVPGLTALMTRHIGGRRVELEAQLAQLALDGVQGLADLTVFGQAQHHFDRFAELHDEFVDLTRRQKQVLALHEGFIGLLMNAAVLAVFSWSTPHIERGSLDGVYLAVLSLGVMAAFEVFLPLPGAAMHLREIECAAARLGEIVGLKLPAIEDVREAQRSVDVGSDIEFATVTFRYGQLEPLVLDNFTLAVPPKGCVIITGPSGSGKSTLINLLLRFWDVEQGRVLVQGRPVAQRDSAFWASRISVAPQRNFFFADSIYENMRLANPGASQKDIRTMCQRLGLHDRIMALKDGYDSPMGEWGVRFSGGDLQRLAVARALLKEAPIYVFDEPTANLDAEGEALMWQLLAGLAEQKTIVVLSHRLPRLGLEQWQVYKMPMGSRIA
jgi:ATP-binding cassette, subfamily C, bacterial CydC